VAAPVTGILPFDRRWGLLKSVNQRTRKMKKRMKRNPRQTKTIVSLPMWLLFLMLCAIPGQAQITLTHRQWEIDVFGGGSFLGSSEHATQVTGSTQQSTRSVGLSYGSGYVVGFRATENRWVHLGGSFEYSFSNQPLTFHNLSDATPSLSLGHSIHRFAYDLLYYPLDKYSRLRPFAFVGPGVSLFYVGGSGKDIAAAQGIHLSDPWKFTMNFGGGVKYLVKDHFAASMQFGDSISDVPAYGLPPNGYYISGKYVPGFRPDGLLNNWLISVGFIYQWDQ
jgi:opacity protein-like surface antigen